MNDGNLLKYFGAVFLLCFAYLGASAQGFNGILPFESTCEDVKRILGGKGCGQSVEKIILPNEKITISYITKKCQRFAGNITAWNLPIGTVFIIVRKFEIPLKPEKIGIKINKNEYNSQTNDIGQIFYIQKNRESVITVADGYVSGITYYGSENNRTKICKPPKKNLLILKRKTREAKSVINNRKKS